MGQVCDRDRKELESRIQPLAERMQEIASASEEATTELRDRLREVDNELRKCKLPEEQPWFQNITESLTSQDKLLRHHAAILNEPRHNRTMDEVCGALMRVETLEQRL